MKVGREERKTRRKVNRKMRRKVRRKIRKKQEDGKMGRQEDGKAGRREGREVEIGREKLERQAVVGPAGLTCKLRLSLNDYVFSGPRFLRRDPPNPSHSSPPSCPRDWWRDTRC
jgi:hypothetical protein